MSLIYSLPRHDTSDVSIECSLQPLGVDGSLVAVSFHAEFFHDNRLVVLFATSDVLSIFCNERDRSEENDLGTHILDVLGSPCREVGLAPALLHFM